MEKFLPSHLRKKYKGGIWGKPTLAANEILLANVSSGHGPHHACEGTLSGGFRVFTHQPVGDAFQVEGSSRGEMLQPCLGHPDIARSTQFEGSHRLRDGSLHARSPFILLHKIFRLLAPPCLLECLVQFLRFEVQDAVLDFCFRALGSARAGTAIGFGKSYRDHLMAPPIHTRLPVRARFALRAQSLMPLPINRKAPDIKTGSLLLLPAAVALHGPDELHAVLTLALDQVLGLPVSAVDPVLVRQ